MQPRTASGEQAFQVGVVIPTFNRADVLIRCLRHLEAQTWTQFEVLVVDDGSTDDTRLRVEAYAAGTPLALRYVRQENSGPACARNRAIRMLRAPVCLMIGDDILAAPELVAEHWALHARQPQPEVAGLGLTRWSEDGQTVTPFMRWLENDGVQFAYGDLLKGSAPTWEHFYTSNLSLKTDVLRRYPFDESFRGYGMEDLELGYRLFQAGSLRVDFLREALAYHFHPTSVAQTCRRMISIGAASHHFGELWPEHRMALSASPLKRVLAALLMNTRWTLPSLRGAATLLTRFQCPNPLLMRVLLLHHRLGYREAERRLGFAQNGRGAERVSERGAP